MATRRIDTHTPALIQPRLSAPSTAIGTGRSGPFVLHKNPKSIGLAPILTDPFRMWSTLHNDADPDDGGPRLNTVAIWNPGLPHLNLWTQITPQAVTTPLTVNVYGGYFMDKTRQQLANNVNATGFPNGFDHTSIMQVWWEPLLRPSDSKQTLNFGTAYQIDKTVATAFRQQHLDTETIPKETFVYCKGADIVLVLIQQAMAGPTHAVLMGHFSS